jgi:hypothetical protein
MFTVITASVLSLGLIRLNASNQNSDSLESFPMARNASETEFEELSYVTGTMKDLSANQSDRNSS